MRVKGMVALGRIVLAKRERVIMLQAWENGLMGTTLRYPYELRATKDYFGDIPKVKIPGEMLKLAEHILETKKADFNPSAFVDHYEEAVVATMLGNILLNGHLFPSSGTASFPRNAV